MNFNDKKINIEEFLDQQGPNSNKNSDEDSTTQNKTAENTIAESSITESNVVNTTETSVTATDANSQSDGTTETSGTDGN